MDERLEVLASLMPGKEEPMNTTVVDEVSCIQAITSEMDEGTFLRNHIVEIRHHKDGFCFDRADQAN